MTTYYYVLASQKFLLEEEPFAEVLKERRRDYAEKKKDIDFWDVKQPAFLEAPEMSAVKIKYEQDVQKKYKSSLPSVAIISTDAQFITWLKLRLEYVITGEFEAPSATIADPLASMETVS
jgi:hypothetical protein